jgi:acetylornithine deacetylase/succinyl-diaminopimelate desuccinylase-like protein
MGAIAAWCRKTGNAASGIYPHRRQRRPAGTRRLDSATALRQEGPMRGAAYQDELHRFIEAVLEDIGPRESCSDNERRLGQRLAERWRSLGFAVHGEQFRCHPKAFLGFIPVSALLYLVAIVAYWVFPWLCVLSAAAAAVMLIAELVRYEELLDPLFPAAHGENVIAVIPPRETPRQRVIVSAHQDSAYEFTLWYLLKNAAVPVMLIGFFAVFVPLLGGLAKALSHHPGAHVFHVVGYLGMALYPFVGLNLVFHTYSVVPGAMDDLAGISVLVGVAQALADARIDGVPALQHTEVRLLAASSEEAGLRGSKRYVSAHRRELTELPTFGLFVDGVYDERHLTVLRREIFTGVTHDRRLVELAREIAGARGWSMHEHTLALGATDATPFSRAGIPAVALLCQDATRLVPNYHTRHDTLEHVRPEALGVMLQLVLDMIQRLDDGAASAAATPHA